MITFAEYIWLDGATPVSQLRSKARVVEVEDIDNVSVEDFPEWSYDGSSTAQSPGNDSDLLLKPVHYVYDPIRADGSFLVMCEVMNADGTPHASNSRAQLRKVLDNGAGEQDPWMGFEQEYTLFYKNIPLGWPEHGYPAPQGPYYCGVGTEQIFGRELVEAHAQACVDAGIMIYGINAEVMPGQWEFQIGYRGFEGEAGGALRVSDELWISRWLLHRLSEHFEYHVSFDNKPIKGDWNGAGMHTNFSTNATRNKDGGGDAIHAAVEQLSKKHNEHITIYGDKLHERLTGDHETCDITQFKSGTADRGCSIRIPQQVAMKGYGYLEDRRPGANADPYLVSARLCATVCEVDEKHFDYNWKGL